MKLRAISMYRDRKDSAAMLAVKKSVAVAPEMNPRNPLHAGDKAHKQEIHPESETQGRYYLKSKTGVSVAPAKRTYILQKICMFILFKH